MIKIHRLLACSSVVVPYSTLHRFAVQEPGFGRKAAMVPIADGEPGHELQVDTGWVLSLEPDRAGVRRRKKAFTFTPNVSRYRFVYPIDHEIAACEAAWAFYGGIFRVMVVDNAELWNELSSLRFLETHALGAAACRCGHILAHRCDRMLKALRHARLDATYEAELRLPRPPKAEPLALAESRKAALGQDPPRRADWRNRGPLLVRADTHAGGLSRPSIGNEAILSSSPSYRRPTAGDRGACLLQAVSLR